MIAVFNRFPRLQKFLHWVDAPRNLACAVYVNHCKWSGNSTTAPKDIDIFVYYLSPMPPFANRHVWFLCPTVSFRVVNFNC